MPEDYSPLGASAAFGSPDEFSEESGANKTDEILLVNATVDGGDPRVNLVEQVGVQIDGNGDVNPGSTSVLHTLPDEENPWVSDGISSSGDTDNQRALRDVEAGDVDDDGLEEIIVVFVDTSAADRLVKIKVIEDMEDGYQELEETIADGDGVMDVSIATGDFDGDGADQIAVVLTKDAESELLFLTPAIGRRWRACQPLHGGRGGEQDACARRRKPMSTRSRSLLETSTTTTPTSWWSSSTSTLEPIARRSDLLRLRR